MSPCCPRKPPESAPPNMLMSAFLLSYFPTISPPHTICKLLKKNLKIYSANICIYEDYFVTLR